MSASIFRILETLSETSSRNEKESILQHQKHFDLHEVFLAAYDPRINFYVKDESVFSLLSESDNDSTVSLYDDEERCDVEIKDDLIEAISRAKYYLSTRTITGNDAKKYIQSQYSALSEEDREVYKRVLMKDLRCGVSATTYNKVFPNSIYEHPYMRCSGFNEKTLKNIKFPCFSQPKIDGMYVDIVSIDGDVKCLTRSGQDVTHYLGDKDVQTLSSTYSGWVLQGEVLVLDSTLKAFLDRKTGNGYLNSDEVDPSQLQFVIWDCVKYDQWSVKGEIDSSPYEKRLNNAEYIVRTHLSESFIAIPTIICNNSEDIMQCFKNARLTDLEGTVIKNKDSKWKSGTSKDQIKVKVVADFDLKVVGYKFGKGKHEGKLGAITCQSADGLLEVSVGGGFSDQQREDLLQEIDQLIKKEAICTILGNDVIKDVSSEDSKWSIFLPRFVEFRTDKTEADTLERCQDQVKSFTDALNLIK